MRIKGKTIIISSITVLTIITTSIIISSALAIRHSNPILPSPTKPTSTLITRRTPTLTPPISTSSTPIPSTPTPSTPTPPISTSSTPTPSTSTPLTPTPAGIPNPYPPHTGTLVMSDPLTDNSKGYQWDEKTVGIASCGFSGGVYHIQATAQGGAICNPEAPSLSLSNFTYEISLKAIQGEFEGTAFRFNQSNLTGYGFLIDAQLGTYVLAAANGTSTPFSLILNGQSPAIKTGLNQTNVLAVVAKGSTINLYINNQFIATATDSTYFQGQIGIFTIDSQGLADIEASNARAWTL